MADQKLTDCERLWIWRKWRKGVTQRRAAHWFDVGYGTYSGWENGLHRTPERVVGAVSSVPKNEVKLRSWERVALARRRSGLTLRQVAKRARMSHVAYLERERVGDAGLLHFWGLLPSR